MSFFGIVNIILINIIFGIIIDTFASLRAQKFEMLNDMKTKCYICGQDRYVFEKSADGFENHIERDHQLWNYIYFIYYIKYKDSTEYNGVESYITEKI